MCQAFYTTVMKAWLASMLSTASTQSCCSYAGMYTARVFFFDGPNDSFRAKL